MKGFFLPVVLLVLIVTCTRNVMSKKDGAPLGICETMTPGHTDPATKKVIESQTSECPYKIFIRDIPKFDAEPKAWIFLKVKETEARDTTFKGFFIQARKNGEPVGEFFTEFEGYKLSKAIKAVSCPKGSQSNNAVTHTGGKPKGYRSVSFLWASKKSLKDKEKIQFVVTFVKDYSNFWVNVTLEWTMKEHGIKI